jgi:hypothetical protein
MSVKTAEQERNEKIIRQLYSLAEAKAKDTPAFVSQLNTRSSSRVAVARTATVPRSRWTHRSLTFEPSWASLGLRTSHSDQYFRAA